MTTHTHSFMASRLEDKASRMDTILLCYRVAEKPLTDREVMARCGFIDPNSCRPRITELINQGHLVERGSIKCPVTGKTVRLVGIPYRIQHEMEF